MKILVRRVGGLGDILLTLPYLQALQKQQGPKDEVHLLAHGEHVELLKALGFLKQGFAEEQSGWHHFYTPEAVPWQLVHPDPGIYGCLHMFVGKGMSTTLPSFLEGHITGRVKEIPDRPPRGRKIHASSFYLEQLGEVLPEPLTPPRQVAFPENSRDRFQKFVHTREQGRVRILVHPGSGSSKKNWPVARWGQLLEEFAQDLRIQTMLLQGPSDETQIEEICRAFPPARLQVLNRRQGLVGLAFLLRQCSLLIGNDSGVTHLAALLGVPTIVVFGPSDPVHWAPLGKRVYLLSRPTECAPCHLETDAPCLHDECVRFPAVSEVRDAVRRLIRSG